MRTLLCLVVLASLTHTVFAQSNRGFDMAAKPSANNDEMVRQSDMWVMEIQFKKPRLVYVEQNVPGSNQPELQEVWYLAWRSIVRPLPQAADDPSLPVNPEDAKPGPTQFIPQFLLVTYDNPQTEIPIQTLPDQIIPGAMMKIRKIETRPGSTVEYKDSVSVIQDLPDSTPVDADEQNWIYGAATWSGVNKDTDFFKVIAQGFSNGYEIKAEGDQAQVWRKVLVQKFTRPGDQFDPNLREFNFDGEPVWTYQPDDSQPVLPKRDVAAQ